MLLTIQLYSRCNGSLPCLGCCDISTRAGEFPISNAYRLLRLFNVYLECPDSVVGRCVGMGGGGGGALRSCVLCFKSVHVRNHLDELCLLPWRSNY